MNKGGIYCIKNKTNGKIYIGQAGNCGKRLKDHKNKLKRNKHCNCHLQNAFNKYGIKNFEFKPIIFLINSEIKDLLERYLIKVFRKKKLCYNLDSGGNKNKEHHLETKKKISDATKGENNPWYGKHLSEEHKKKLSEVRKEKYTGENHPYYGKHHSEETRKKISDAKKGKYTGENSPRTKLKNEHIPYIFKLRDKGYKTQWIVDKIYKKYNIKISKSSINEILRGERFKNAIKEFGLKPYPRNRISKLIKQNILKDYKNGMSRKELMQKYNRSYDSINSMIQREKRKSNVL